MTSQESIDGHSDKDWDWASLPEDHGTMTLDTVVTIPQSSYFILYAEYFDNLDRWDNPIWYDLVEGDCRLFSDKEKAIEYILSFGRLVANSVFGGNLDDLAILKQADSYLCQIWLTITSSNDAGKTDLPRNEFDDLFPQISAGLRALRSEERIIIASEHDEDEEDIEDEEKIGYLPPRILTGPEEDGDYQLSLRFREIKYVSVDTGTLVKSARGVGSAGR